MHAVSSSFKRAFKNRIAGRKRLEEKFWKRVEIFRDDPHDARLRTHKLSSDLQEYWSFSVEHDVRVVFQFAAKNRAVFQDIGSHDEVY
ncbi:MAG: type II toxin-antitoxin system mRNA interferase toxin, RelE/StbE family [Verrucomicrobia bacterium]|nr:type II toxin-antitoxin system mRNA interferase toxin, RelE/StbE family [Verrucomicrobiota bacterium]